jgi:nicotinate dehydrogenase subunit B
MEGGALQGMSRALFEEVSWSDQGVSNISWRRYKVFQFGQPLPQIVTVPINRLDQPQTGAGECIITAVAAAIANPVFDATGARLRQVPFTPSRVLDALAGRTPMSSAQPRRRAY